MHTFKRPWGERGTFQQSPGSGTADATDHHFSKCTETVSREPQHVFKAWSQTEWGKHIHACWKSREWASGKATLSSSCKTTYTTMSSHFSVISRALISKKAADHLEINNPGEALLKISIRNYLMYKILKITEGRDGEKGQCEGLLLKGVWKAEYCNYLMLIDNVATFGIVCTILATDGSRRVFQRQKRGRKLELLSRML